MRIAFTLLAFLVLSVVLGFAQGGGVSPQDPPHFYTSTGTWSSWTRSAKFPQLSLRGACGDNTTINGIPMFSLYTEVRSDYGYPIALVWAIEFYNKRLGKNVVQGSMLEHIQSGEITQAIAALRGTCQGAPETFYARFDCVVHDGSESTCWGKQGVAIPERTATQYSSLPAQSSGSHGNSVPIGNSQWTCAADLTKQFYVKDPIKDTWTLTFRDDGSFENVSSNGPYSTGGDTWKQQNGQISWYQGALNIGFYGTTSGRTMKLEAKGGATDQQAESSSDVYGTLTCTGKSIPPLKVRPFYWVCQAQGVPADHHDYTFAVSKVFARPAKRLYESRDFMDSLQSEMGAWLKANDSSDFEQVMNVGCNNFETQQEAAADRSERIGHSKAVDWPAQ
jgi:hypothetical protein